MRNANLALGAALLAFTFVGAGCTQTVQPPPVQTQNNVNVDVNVSQPPTGMMPVKKLIATLSAQGGSGQTGTFEATDVGGRTMVVLMVTGEPKGAMQPAHIHAGSCPTPGEVKWSLNDVIDGKSETMLDNPIEDLFAAGALAVNVHKSVAEIKTYVSCGNLTTPADYTPSGALNNGEDMNTNATGSASGDELEPPQNVKAEAREIKVTAKQFEFIPSEIHVKVGEKIKLTLTNEDVPHSIAIPELNVNLRAEAKGSASAEFTAEKAGEYKFFCSVYCGSGHSSMKGKVIAE